MSNFHTSVLLKETIDFLKIRKGKKYVDATIGGGGHGFEILRHGGILLGIDVDEDSIQYVEEKWKIESKKWNINEKNLILAKGNFRDIDKIAHLHGFGSAFGVLFDLGVSSYQLDTPERGFSFGHNGPLDMRMSKDLAVKAADLVNALTKGELYEVYHRLGEEHYAKVLAFATVVARKVKPIETTFELAEIVKKSVSKYGDRINPATRIFQALRIAVNDELNSVKEALPKAVNLLEKGGRLAAISFHSLEDRIVKHTFEDFEKQGKGIILTKKPIIPTIAEQQANRRSRSAKLRIFSAKGGSASG